MNDEHPRTIRRAIRWSLALMLCVALLYVVGSGPAVFLSLATPRSGPFLDAMYAPLFDTTAGTAFEDPLTRYTAWWFERLSDFGYFQINLMRDDFQPVPLKDDVEFQQPRK